MIKKYKQLFLSLRFGGMNNNYTQPLGAIRKIEIPLPS